MASKRPPIFEVRRNVAGHWYWHELGGGQIVAVSQAYSRKWSAKRAARRQVELTPGATMRLVEE